MSPAPYIQVCPDNGLLSLLVDLNIVSSVRGFSFLFPFFLLKNKDFILMISLCVIIAIYCQLGEYNLELVCVTAHHIHLFIIFISKNCYLSEN